MATGTYEGDVYTLQDDAKVGTFPNAKLAGGNVYCSLDRDVAATYVDGIDDGLTLGSTFKMGKLPKGAVVLYTIVYPITTVAYDAPTVLTAATLFSIGDGTTADLFGVTTSFAASIVPQILMPKPDGVTYYANRLAPLTEAVDVIVTSSAVDHTTAEGICVMIFYTM